MEIKIRTQSTPNPSAIKFILDREVKKEGKISFDNVEACSNVPLAKNILELPGVNQVHFFENVITVTADSSDLWSQLNGPVNDVIAAGMATHDASFEVGPTETERRSYLSKEVQTIESILDRTIRPGLQMDGGDLDVVEYDATRNLVVVQYQGACGSCPSSTMGTLMAIQGILRDEFHPDVEVIPL